jgi:uncharacterized protein YndB with AHSA1/START domain
MSTISSPRTLPSKTLTVSIARPPEQVYEFVANPANLPRWAAAFCRSVRQVENRWIVETPAGPVQIEFVAPNPWGVLDHWVMLPSGDRLTVPMRVVANGSGSEVTFTLFQWPGMPSEKFAEDIGMVERDLATLRHVLQES